ncbi:MAG TPA: helix-turn-helix transcriptional regulator [Pyrinomonadaceae bacterium]|nr:helix-turn-helix transcriptional regulator [Pyrinomonadaceae bacterium]
MGRASREKPKHLASKLAQIRAALDLSQDGLIMQMGLETRLVREDISKYERGVREPSLLTLLKYARAAGVSVDVLIDDDMDLPKHLSGKSVTTRRRRKGKLH